MYKYLALNCKHYKLDTLKVKSCKENAKPFEQNILRYNYYTSRSAFQSAAGFRQDVADFDGSVVVTLSPVNDTGVLTLTFFLVLTNRREFYPRLTLHGQVSSLKRQKRTFSGSEGSVSSVIEESQSAGKMAQCHRMEAWSLSGLGGGGGIQ